MADNEGKEEPTARGNEWEVVSLTASTYAAAPGPEQVDVIDDETGNSAGVEKEETSHALFMSGHFVFPPSQHENLPLESASNEISSAPEYDDDGIPVLADKGIRSETKGQEKTNVKGLTISDEFPGIQIFDEKGNILSVGGAEFEEGNTLKGLNLAGKEQSIYSSSKISSFHSETAIGGTLVLEQGAENSEVTEPYGEDSDSGIQHLPNPMNKDYDGHDLPCGAWWKRRAASIYAQAKEANTLWSIVVAAAVTGLVILGQRWQQERWQILQLKWQSSISDEKLGRMLGPLTRIKDVIVGGQHRGSLIRGTSVEH